MKIRVKILGALSLILALILLFQSAVYLLTRRSINSLAGGYGEIVEFKASLDLRDRIEEKMSVLSSYALYQREEYIGQWDYTDKGLHNAYAELDKQLVICGNARQAELLKKVRSNEEKYDGEARAFFQACREEGGRAAAGRYMRKLEETEGAILDDLSAIRAETELFAEQRHNQSHLGIWLNRLIPSFLPALDSWEKMHSSTLAILYDYDMLHSARLLFVNSRRFLLSGETKYATAFDADIKTFNESMVERSHIKGAPDGAQADPLQDFSALSGNISKAFADVVNEYRSGNEKKAEAAVEHSFVDEQMLANGLRELALSDGDKVKSYYGSLAPMMDYSLAFNKRLFIFVATVALLSFILGSLLLKRLLRPISMLRNATEKISQGDWTQKVDVSSHDEISEMACSFNNMTDELEKADMERTKRHLELSALHEVSRAVNRTIELDDLLSEVLNTITRLDVFNLERKGAIFIMDGERMELASHVGESASFTLCHEIKAGDCLCGLAAMAREVVVSENSAEDERHTRRFPHVHPHGHIIVPLMAKDKIVGVLCLYLPAGVEVEEDKKILLQLIGDQVGVAIYNAKLYEETKALSLKDSLTGLANRRMMEIMTNKSFARAKRLGSPFSVIMLDIDYFKKYNDTYGHPAGDSLLVTIAKILLREVREIDLAVRYGGEEFFVLLPDVVTSEALQVADRIRNTVEAESGVTISLGVSSYSRWTEKVEDIVGEADRALYNAKQRGRNRVELGGAVSSTDAA